MADLFTIEIQLHANMQKIDAALDARDVRRFKLLCQRRGSLLRQHQAARATAPTTQEA